MFNFLRSRDPLQDPSPESTAQLLCRLLQENNALLRELVVLAGGRPSSVPRVFPPRSTTTIRTGSDVFRVDRKQILQQERAEAEKQQAPWRTPASGPDSAPPNRGSDESAEPNPANSPRPIPRTPNLL